MPVLRTGMLLIPNQPTASAPDVIPVCVNKPLEVKRDCRELASKSDATPTSTCPPLGRSNIWSLAPLGSCRSAQPARMAATEAAHTPRGSSVDGDGAPRHRCRRVLRIEFVFGREPHVVRASDARTLFCEKSRFERGLFRTVDVADASNGARCVAPLPALPSRRSSNRPIRTIRSAAARRIAR